MADRSRREDILQAARVLFRDKGYHATTIRDIADQSGMLSGSLYAHIRTKEDLLFEIVNEVADAFLIAMQTVVMNGQSATAQYRLGLAAHSRVVSEHLAAAAVFTHEWRHLSAQRQAMIQHKRDAYEDLWKTLLANGIASGEFHATNARYARLVTLSVANWLYQWYDPSGSLGPEEVALRFADVLLAGVSSEDRGGFIE